MKKFYTLALATAVALSASAFDAKTFSKDGMAVNHRAIATATSSTKAVKAPVKASEYDSYTWTEVGKGKYVASIIADYYGASTDPTDVTVFEANGHAGVYKLSGVWPDVLTGGELIIDASDPDFVTVPAQSTGIIDNVDGITYIASQTAILLDKYSKDEIIAGAPNLIITLKDKVINIPAEALVLNWPEAPADSKYGTDPTSWYIGDDSEGVVVLPGGTYVDPWTSLGTGVFLENMLYPVFTGVENTATCDVEVLQKTSDPNILKIKDPFKATYEAIDHLTTSPDMIIDITNPENISIEMQSTGLQGSTDGEYFYFDEAWYNENFGQGSDVTEETLRVKLTKDGDNSTITIPVHSITVYASGTNKFYYGAEYVSTLTFKAAGISDVAVDNAQGEVEFFNLQGVRVANPENGIFIRRQGNTATKVFVK